jgi:hypothetical protein
MFMHVKSAKVIKLAKHCQYSTKKRSTTTLTANQFQVQFQSFAGSKEVRLAMKVVFLVFHQQLREAVNILVFELRQQVPNLQRTPRARLINQLIARQYMLELLWPRSFSFFRHIRNQHYHHRNRY